MTLAKYSILVLHSYICTSVVSFGNKKQVFKYSTYPGLLGNLQDLRLFSSPSKFWIIYSIEGDTHRTKHRNDGAVPCSHSLSTYCSDVVSHLHCQQEACSQVCKRRRMADIFIEPAHVISWVSPAARSSSSSSSFPFFQASEQVTTCSVSTCSSMNVSSTEQKELACLYARDNSGFFALSWPQLSHTHRLLELDKQKNSEALALALWIYIYMKSQR